MILSHLCTREAPLLSILRRELALSSGLVKRLKWQDALLLNGVPVHTNARVRPGDRVTVDLSETVVGYEGEDVPLNILYEDDCCLAVDKPRGMLVHPSPRRNSGTLANAVLGYYQRTGQACGVHPVTRLDRDTFGVVLFAKNAYIHEKFCEMQKKHQISKTYHASVYGAKMAERRPDRPADPEAAGKKPSPDCRTKREEMQNIICCFSTLSGRFSAGIEAGHRENAPAARTL